MIGIGNEEEAKRH